MKYATIKVTGGSNPAFRQFVEMFVRNPRRNKDKLGEAASSFLEALNVLPYAKILIESRNYIGLIEYFGEVISDMQSDKRLNVWLETFRVIDKKLDEHLRHEPLIKVDTRFPRERPYAHWCEKKGFLLAQLNHAHNECLILKETVLEPNKQKIKAIKVLREHVDDYISDQPRRIKEFQEKRKQEMKQKERERELETWEKARREFELLQHRTKHS